MADKVGHYKPTYALIFHWLYTWLKRAYFFVVCLFRKHRLLWWRYILQCILTELKDQHFNNNLLFVIEFHILSNTNKMSYVCSWIYVWYIFKGFVTSKKRQIFIKKWHKQKCHVTALVKIVVEIPHNLIAVNLKTNSRNLIYWKAT